MLAARRLVSSATLLRGPAVARVSFWAQDGPAVSDVTVNINFVDEEVRSGGPWGRV